MLLLYKNEITILPYIVFSKGQLNPFLHYIKANGLLKLILDFELLQSSLPGLGLPLYGHVLCRGQHVKRPTPFENIIVMLFYKTCQTLSLSRFLIGS